MLRSRGESKIGKEGGRRGYNDNRARTKVGLKSWRDSEHRMGGEGRARTSLAQGLKYSANAIPPRRNAEVGSLLLLTKLAAASSVVYLTFRWWAHHPRQQRRAIAKMFATNTEILIDKSVPKLERKSEEAFLRKWFTSPPNGPIVLAGPSGSGRSYLIKSVLSDRKMTIYVDYRAQPVVSGEEHIATFVASTGYIIPQVTDIMRMFTREEQRKTKITPQEADRALAVILQALQDCKANRWRDGIPLICLDDFTVSSVRASNTQNGANNTLELDPFWTKFLDWCTYVSDAKLAHIVFVPSHSFEPHHPLYDHPTFRTKRVLLFVDYPSLDKVRSYVNLFVSSLCKIDHQSSLNIGKASIESSDAERRDSRDSINRDSADSADSDSRSVVSPQYMSHMVGWITNCLGGHLDDLMHILGGLRRGDKYGSVLRRMITDAVSTIEERLEQVLSEAHNPSASKEDVYKKYLRLWAAMEMLRDNEVVNRRDIVRHVFREHTAELKQYVEWGVFAYANQKAEIDDGNGDSQDSHVNSSLSSSSSSKSIYQPSSYPSPNNSDSSSSSQGQNPSSSSSQISSSSSGSPSSSQGSRPYPYPVWWKSEPASLPSNQKQVDGISSTSSTSSTSSSDASNSSNSSSQNAVTNNSSSSTTNESGGSSYVSPTTKRSHSTLLNASLESMLVTAGSPRIRIAFDLLLKDERLADRKEAMAIHLSVKSTQDRMDKIDVSRKQRLEELQVTLAETNRLLTLLSVWKEEFGNEFVESRKTRLMRQETEIYQHLDALQKENDRLLEQKTQLEARAKQLTVKL